MFRRLQSVEGKKADLLKAKHRACLLNDNGDGTFSIVGTRTDITENGRLPAIVVSRVPLAVQSRSLVASSQQRVADRPGGAPEQQQQKPERDGPVPALTQQQALGQLPQAQIHRHQSPIPGQGLRHHRQNITPEQNQHTPHRQQQTILSKEDYPQSSHINIQHHSHHQLQAPTAHAQPHLFPLGVPALSDAPYSPFVQTSTSATTSTTTTLQGSPEPNLPVPGFLQPPRRPQSQPQANLFTEPSHPPETPPSPTAANPPPQHDTEPPSPSTLSSSAAPESPRSPTPLAQPSYFCPPSRRKFVRKRCQPRQSASASAQPASSAKPDIPSTPWQHILHYSRLLPDAPLPASGSAVATLAQGLLNLPRQRLLPHHWKVRLAGGVPSARVVCGLLVYLTGEEREGVECRVCGTGGAGDDVGGVEDNGIEGDVDGEGEGAVEGGGDKEGVEREGDVGKGKEGERDYWRFERCVWLAGEIKEQRLGAGWDEGCCNTFVLEQEGEEKVIGKGGHEGTSEEEESDGVVEEEEPEVVEEEDADWVDEERSHRSPMSE